MDNTNEQAIHQWTDDMSVKCHELDNQHRHMVEIIEEAFQAYSKGELQQEFGVFLDRLAQYVIYHFTMEEVYFDLFQFNEKESHINEHNLFRRKIEDLKKRNNWIDPGLQKDFIDFLKNWLENHIIISDQKYVSCFLQHGLK